MLPPRASQVPDLLAVVVSAGAIDVVSRLLAVAPAPGRVGILVATHSPPGSVDGFLRLLTLRHPAWSCAVLEDGPAPGPGELRLVPSGVSVVVRDGRLERVPLPPDESGAHRLDVVLAGLAPLGPRLAVLVGSGAGHDSSRALPALAKAGCTLMVQDPAEALLDGMPKAALRAVPGIRVGKVEVLAEWLLGKASPACAPGRKGRKPAPRAEAPRPDPERATREELLALLRESEARLEAVVEELRLSNEELQVNNTELREAVVTLEGIDHERRALAEESELRLRATEEARTVLANVMAATNDALVLLDADRVVVSANAAAERLLGLSRAHLGLRIEDVPLAAAHVTATRLELIRLVLAGQAEATASTGDVRGIRQESVAAVRGDDRRVSGFVLTASDIASVMEVQNRLELAMEAAVLVWWEWDLATDLLVPHATTRCILGFALDCLARTGDAWHALVHPDDRDAVASSLEAVLAGPREEWSIEHRFRTNAGTWKWVSNHGRVVARDSRGRALRMVGTTRDIQARREAQERSRVLGEALEQSPAATLIVGPRGVVEYANAAAGTILGIPKAGLAGRRFKDILEVEGPGDSARTILRSIYRRGCWRGEFAARRPDGTAWLGRGSAIVLRGPGGRRTHAVGILEDITAQRLAEQELTRAKERAEQASRAKSEFLAVMSHEIRTPLNPILGITQLLLAEIADPEQRHLVQLVHDSGQHLLLLLSDVLDLAKIESGSLAFSASRVDLAGLASAILDMRRPETDRRGISLALRDELGPGHVFFGDERRLRQVLLNLVANAVKFTERGGVEVALRPRPEGGVVVTVADTGIGIPADQLEAIFEPFHQVNSTMSRRYEGAGLGLSICRRLLALMGGTITAASEPGRGSTFTVVLPATAVPARGAERGDGRAARADVLVVEDDDASRAVIAALVRRLGCTTREAANGRQALALFRDAAPDLVLMDLEMPLLGGLAATLELRALGGAGERVPIIALSAAVAPGDREKCFAAGMNAFLAKPATLGSLRETLRRYLGDRVPA